LDNLLQHLIIGGETMKATDFIDVDKDTHAFNEWFDNCENLIAYDIIVSDDDYNNIM